MEDLSTEKRASVGASSALADDSQPVVLDALKLVKSRDRQTDGRQTVTLRLPLDAASKLTDKVKFGTVNVGMQGVL